jgi:hypothetical protein
MKLSLCCLKPVLVNTGDEGTSCYICPKCKKPCDTEEVCNRCGVSRRAAREHSLMCQDEHGIHDHHTYKN